jgi:hypothetical protein
MTAEKICQSCTMPIDDPLDRGTNKDGSKSGLYCKYCYQDGSFTDPSLTLAEMKENAIAQMKKQDIDAGIIQRSLEMMDGLERWKK